MTSQRKSRRVVVFAATGSLVCGGLLLPATAQAHPARPALSHQGAHSQRAVHLPEAAAVQLLGGPGVWTKLSNGVGGSGNEAGLLRTSDGRLHVVWHKYNKSTNDDSIGYSTISMTGTLVKTGVAVAHWFSLNGTARLVPDGKNIRLVFNGSQDTNSSNKFSRGARYTETSTNGSTWSLVNGSLASHTTFNLSSFAATTQANGTPVTMEALNSTLYYHVGVDPMIPSSTADKQIDGQGGSGLYGAELARDKDGSVWAAWFQKFGSKQGYYVEKLLPSKASAVKAPNSGNPNLQDNGPRQKVAFAARVGGGLYLAYCQENKVYACARIVLWKVGSKSARTVPGTSTGSAHHVTLSAGPHGRMVVGWYDYNKNVFHVVRTNTKATAFGVTRTIKAPAKMFSGQMFGLYSESSSGRIDLVANVQETTAGNPTDFFHTQVLAGLKVSASPTRLSHLHSGIITFRVTDAGEAVAGATVSFLGHKAHTNSKGLAKITVGKGQKKGAPKATASKTLYYKATVTVKIT